MALLAMATGVTAATGGAAVGLLLATAVPIGAAVGAGMAISEIEGYPTCNIEDYHPTDHWTKWSGKCVDWNWKSYNYYKLKTETTVEVCR